MLILQFVNIKENFMELGFVYPANHWIHTLNPKQQEAAVCTEGPLLVLAGAGSGKTSVITCRAARLVESGVNPRNILAVTFTNKATTEMQERIEKLIPNGGRLINVSTFHSACLTILRKHCLSFNLRPGFSVYDSDAQKSLLKTVLRDMISNKKEWNEAFYQTEIEHAKNNLLMPDDLLTYDSPAPGLPAVKEVYERYQEALRQNQAVDFNDIIMNVVQLFRYQPKVLDFYQEAFPYIMVDEYQDTNKAQFELVRLLAAKYGNLCVVGDDDQSIYGWRDADVRNILDFPSIFPGTTVVKLEQNYRSTKKIIRAADNVIHFNKKRMEKTLWTDNIDGDNIRLLKFDSDFTEAIRIVDEILDRGEYGDTAIICRSSTPLRRINAFLERRSIPCKMVGVIDLYDRKEIRDLIAYLQVIVNPSDSISFKRAAGFPKRGIGEGSLDKLSTYATLNGISMIEACLQVDEIPGLARGASAIRDFGILLLGLNEAFEADLYTISDLVDDIIRSIGMYDELTRVAKDGQEEVARRKENIEDFISRVKIYEHDHDSCDVIGFLSYVTLTILSKQQDESACVKLMTAHAAKGLEFPHVYICGLEEDLFPHCKHEGLDGLEEERRLFYVAITRAMKSLTLTYSKVRYDKEYSPSSFLDELPAEIISVQNFINQPSY